MKIVAATVALLLSSGAAYAQNQNYNNSDSLSGASVSIYNSNPSKTRSRIDTTASAFSPGLTAAGVHSCAGSTSAGVGLTGLNVGLGSTYEMQECNRRAYAATLSGMGLNKAALALVCNNEEVMRSLNQTGVICPQQEAEAAAQASRAQPNDAVLPQYAESAYEASQPHSGNRNGSYVGGGGTSEASDAPPPRRRYRKARRPVNERLTRHSTRSHVASAPAVEATNPAQ